MVSGDSQLREFGRFRLDAKKRVLWCEDQPVNLPLKEIELLCVLTEHSGQVVTKDEILDRLWADSFVEESNLTRHIYLLRKTLKEYGEAEDLIQTVPRRGYRFRGKVRRVNGSDVVIERHSITETLIEDISERSIDQPGPKGLLGRLNGKKPKALVLTTVVVLAAVAALALRVYRSDLYTTTPVDVRSIAVLPLQSLANNESERAVSLGLTDALISKLGGLGRFAIRPFSAVQKYEKGEMDALVFGRQLKVDAVLEGSLQFASERLRVSVRLLRVSDGLQIWAGSFDESETDILKLQDSLSAQVADSLIVGMSPEEKRRLASRPTDDPEAYKLYLRGRHAWNKRTPDGLRKSVRLFQEAIDRDPTVALAYAGLADSYVVLNDYNAAGPREAYPKAKAAAQKALDIDPSLVEPRTTVAYVLANYEWNYAEAEREYRRAIEQNANYPTAHQWYGELLYHMKRFRESEKELERAVELDPLAPVIISELAFLKYYEREFDRAIALSEKTSQDFPGYQASYLLMSWAYEQKHMPEEAFVNEIRFWNLQGVDQTTLAGMEHAFRRDGYVAYLRKVAEMLERAAERGQLFHEYRLVHIYARLHDREKTLEWLDRGIRNGSAMLVKIAVDPNFDFLRADERFQGLQRELGIHW